LTWDCIKGKYRIVCLGDSITFGEGLPYTQAYPAVLEALLRQSFAQKGLNYDIVVINSGMCGHTAVQGLARLERDVLWYRPHIVVLAFGLNDGRLGHWPLDPLREREVCGDDSLRGRAELLLRHSHLWQTLRARTRRLLRTLRPVDAKGLPKALASQGEPRPRVSRRGFQIALERLAASVRGHGATLFLLTTTPTTEAFNAQWEPARRQRQAVIYDEYERVIKDVATKSGGRLLDIHAIFAQRSPAGLASLVAADGVHLTQAGERLLAESVLQALEESDLPEHNTTTD